MISHLNQLNPVPVTTYNYQNTSPNNAYANNNVLTMPDKKKTMTMENEKINENNPVTNSGLYIQTNVNNFTQNEVNKPNKFQVNQTNYKFIETLNNNDRNNTNTAQANFNTVVQLTNNDINLKNSKLQTSFNKSM